MPVEKKEKPILFSTEMVRAILEGRKTQTRRVIKPQPESYVHHLDCWNKEKGEWIKTSRSGKVMIFQKPNIIKCPWQVGQELWVRETWKPGAWEEDGRVAIDYKASPELTNTPWIYYPEESFEDNFIKWTDELLSKGLITDKNGRFNWEPGKSPLKWRPSIFMPRWASRIQLLIKNIRVERVQDISGEEARKEGIENQSDLLCNTLAQEWFQNLWDSINANRKDKDGNILPYSWNHNPLVWCISFERIK